MQNGLRGFVRSLGVPNLRKWLAGLGAIAAAGGITLLLSAQVPAAGTDPAKIAAALQSCEAGKLDACYTYASAIMAKKAPSSAEKTTAFKSYEKACVGNVTQACQNAGLAYITGAAGKTDLKLARKYEAKGCAAGDNDACKMQKRLENPPPTAAGLTKLPAELQSKVNLALYVVDKGGELIFLQARVETGGLDQQIQADMYEAACDMAYYSGCANAASMYANPPSPIKSEKPVAKNSKRALALSRKGCANDDGLSCLIVAVMIKESTGMDNEAHAAYRKSVPYLKKECDNNNGSQCMFLGDIYRYGYGYQQDFALSAQYYQKACDNYQRSSCQSAIEVRQIVTNEENDRQREAGYRSEREAREEQERQASASAAQSESSLSPICSRLSDRFVDEMEDYQTRAKSIVDNQDKNFNLMWDKNANQHKFYELGNQKCVNMLSIARQAQNNNCPAEMSSAMISGIPQLFQNMEASSECYRQSRQMGANWNFQRY